MGERKARTSYLCKYTLHYNVQIFFQTFVKTVDFFFKNNGGIVIGYADYLEIEDKGCIILAKKDYNPHLENNNVFDVNFVDDCIKKEKVLDISKYK